MSDVQGREKLESTHSLILVGTHYGKVCFFSNNNGRKTVSIPRKVLPWCINSALNFMTNEDMRGYLPVWLVQNVSHPHTAFPDIKANVHHPKMAFPGVKMRRQNVYHRHKAFPDVKTLVQNVYQYSVVIPSPQKAFAVE